MLAVIVNYVKYKSSWSLSAVQCGPRMLATRIGLEWTKTSPSSSEITSSLPNRQVTLESRRSSHLTLSHWQPLATRGSTSSSCPELDNRDDGDGPSRPLFFGCRATCRCRTQGNSISFWGRGLSIVPIIIFYRFNSLLIHITHPQWTPFPLCELVKFGVLLPLKQPPIHLWQIPVDAALFTFRSLTKGLPVIVWHTSAVDRGDRTLLASSSRVIRITVSLNMFVCCMKTRRLVTTTPFRYRKCDS